MNNKIRGKQNNYSGLCAEKNVASAYKAKGCNVLHHRWRSKSGEIDLIVNDGDYLIFCEVKKRKTFELAYECLTNNQKKRIVNSALEFLAQSGLPIDTNMRFDLAAVNQIGAIDMIENALAA